MMNRIRSLAGAGFILLLLLAMAGLLACQGESPATEETTAAAQASQAAQTQDFVDDALRRYQTNVAEYGPEEGLETTLAYYNSPESVEGQWYVFIIDEDNRIIGHYNPDSVGLDANDLEDSTGYLYGPDILEADEDGRWVSYVWLNPETGEEQRKHSWVVRLDGLIFGSGWYE